MKNFYFIVIILGLIATSCLAQEKPLLIDDFEGQISGGPEGTVDFGSGNGSSVTVTGASDIKHQGNQSLKVVYDAEPGGYMYVAKGFDLDAKNAGWIIVLKDIDWTKFNAISFYMYGSDSKTKIAFDIKDNGNEMWRFMVEDNFKGWKQIVCPFNEFFARADWQPQSADNNALIDFPVKSFQFEPRPELEAKKGELYLDEVELLNR